jgi:predicted MFS family arabinose efflux permease
VKRTFLLTRPSRSAGLVAAGTGLVAATYGLVRLAYGLLLPDMQVELGFDGSAAGTISAGASVVYCVGALVGFVAAPRRARALVVAAGASAAAGAAGMALAPAPGPFAAAAVLSSAGAGLASPALVALVQRGVPAPSRDRAQTVVNAGTGPGLVVAGTLALLLLPDWRSAWLVAASATAVVAALVLVLGRSAPGGAAAPRVVPPASWVVAHRRVLAAALLLGAGSAAVWTYGRTLLTAAGAAPALSTVAWIALGLGGAAVIGTARWTDALRPGAAWAATAGVVAAASAALAVAAGSTPAALVACVAFGWGYTAATGALIAWTTRIDASRAPTGTAILFVTLVLGQAVGAAGAGALVGAAGYGATFLAAAVVAAVGALLGVRSPSEQALRLLGSRHAPEASGDRARSVAERD